MVILVQPQVYNLYRPMWGGVIVKEINGPMDYNVEFGTKRLTLF